MIPKGGMNHAVDPKEAVMGERIVYRVPGMSCDHCKKAVTGELMAVPGVNSVEVNLDDKSVVVSGTGLDDNALRNAIDEAGYEAQ